MNTQRNNILIIIGGMAAIGAAIVSILAYIEKRDHKEVESDILKLDRQIKQLQLEKAKSEVVQIYS